MSVSASAGASSRRSPDLRIGRQNEITCAAPLAPHSRNISSSLMVVGLASGLVCVFDTRTSRVVRAVQLENRVTAIDVVSPGKSHAMIEDATTLDPARDFCGILAVGTQEGHVMLLDLCLDDYEPGRRNY